MIQWLLLWFGEVGSYQLRRLGLALSGVVLLVAGLPLLLHDVLKILRTDGASCDSDSNCLSFCHHPEHAPSKGYCSSQCEGSGHCKEGMRCAQTTSGWTCVQNLQLRYGASCAEDAACASERCELLSANEDGWISPEAESKPVYQAGFCVVPCAEGKPCPLGDPCSKLRSTSAAVCIPKAQVALAAFSAQQHSSITK